MKKTLLYISVCIACGSMAVAQDRAPQEVKENTSASGTAIHRVAMGETVVLIAKKYMVTPYDIYQANPEAVNGLSQGMALKIPLDKTVTLQNEDQANESFKVVKVASLQTQVDDKLKSETMDHASEAVPPPPSPPVSPEYHTVSPGETLSGLARKYNTTVEQITEANKAVLKRGLQAGQELTIPPAAVAASESFREPSVAKKAETPSQPAQEAKNPISAAVLGQPEVKHEVQPGETLTGLARKYNTTIEQITEANKKMLKRGLQAGQELTIPSAGGIQADSQASAAAIQDTAEAAVVSGTSSVIKHEVQPGETLTGLARKYNTTIEQITEANKKLLKRGLQAGQELVIPSSPGPAASQNDVAAAGSGQVEKAEDTTATAIMPVGEGSEIKHEVQPGETLTGLARKYNTTIAEITETNKKTLKKGLQAGQVITITPHHAGQ